MKIPKRSILVINVLMFASVTQAAFLTYSNTVAASPGNPPIAAPFNIPQFNAANGTLDSVTLTLSGYDQSFFNYNGVSAHGGLTVWQDNILSIIYGGSSVLAQAESIFVSPTYPTPIPLPGNGSFVWSGSLPKSQVTFSSSPDLNNFTGIGNIPIGAEYYNNPTVTITGSPVTWSLNNSSSMTVVLMYNYTPAPEPGAIGFFFVGGVTFCVVNARKVRSVLFGFKTVNLS
jgi:hypothetical protein